MHKENFVCLWIALVFLLLFLVPLLNVLVFLPLAVFFCMKQILRVKKNPEKYGGFMLSIVILMYVIISYIMSLGILILSITKGI